VAKKRLEDMTTEELAQKYIDYIKKTNEAGKKKREDPTVRQLRSISQMIYQARKKGNMERVKLLEERWATIKEQQYQSTQT